MSLSAAYLPGRGGEGGCMGKYDRMTDEQLIAELRAGNSEIMDYIMVKYKSMVRKKARAMFLLGGENEDL